MIRVESVVDGSLVAQLPTDEAILWGRFLLGGEHPHLVYTNQETVRIYELRAGAAKLTTELPESYVMTVMPTSDSNTVLLSHNYGGTSVTPLNVATGKPGEQYQYVPPMLTQLFGSKQFPANTVRVVPAAPGGTSSIVQLVEPLHWRGSAGKRSGGGQPGPGRLVQLLRSEMAAISPSSRSATTARSCLMPLPARPGRSAHPSTTTSFGTSIPAWTENSSPPTRSRPPAPASTNPDTSPRWSPARTGCRSTRGR